MTGCIGDVQLEEEEEAAFGVVGLQSCDGVPDTAAGLAPQTPAQRGLGQAEERRDKPSWVTCDGNRRGRTFQALIHWTSGRLRKGVTNPPG